MNFKVLPSSYELDGKQSDQWKRASCCVCSRDLTKSILRHLISLVVSRKFFLCYMLLLTTALVRPLYWKKFTGQKKILLFDRESNRRKTSWFTREGITSDGKLNKTNCQNTKPKDRWYSNWLWSSMDCT